LQSLKFLGGVGFGFLATLGVGVGFFVRARTTTQGASYG